MYSLHLNLILLGLSHIPLLAAEYLLRAKPPAPTIAPLFRRQFVSVCAAGATSCHDGGPGCCDYGELCTFDEHHVPICQGACNGGPTCSGALDGLCCNQGFTCNYQSTLCESETIFPITTSMTNAPSSNSPNVTPSNTQSTHQAPTPAPPSPNTLSTPQRTVSSTPPQASPQSATTTSSQSSPPSSSLTSDVSTSTSANPSPIPPVISTPPSTDILSKTSSTPVQSASTTATVNPVSGATSWALGAGSVIVFRLLLLYFGLGMMTII